MKRPALSPASILLGAAATVLVLFLGIGWLLPGTWSAERAAVLAAPPSAVFPWVDSPSGWQRWTPWPDSGVVREGPEHGAGARLAWNDKELGNGSFEIVEARPDSLVRYRVIVQEGEMHTDGTMRLSHDGAGTRIQWREEGDFGGNPLMGYWARFMEHAQGAELEKALDRLSALAEAEPGAAPANSGAMDASG
jgi:hypothetical protein